MRIASFRSLILVAALVLGTTAAFAGEEAGGAEGLAGGTLYYAAPELLVGEAPGPRSDLFAVGVLVHELLVGERRPAAAFYADFPRRDFLEAAGTPAERLPDWARPKPTPSPFVLGIDDRGAVMSNLQDPSGGRFGMVTSAQELDGRLYLGSLTGRVAAWHALSP